MKSTTRLPTPASWALTVAQAPTPQAGWEEFARCVGGLGFANVAFTFDIARFNEDFPPAEKMFGFMLNEHYTHLCRTEADVRQVAHKVPIAASFGRSESVFPELELRASDLPDAGRKALELMADAGLKAGWSFPVVDRVRDSFSTVLLDCPDDLSDQQHLVDEHHDYLKTSCMYLHEGLTVHELVQDCGPDLLSAREADCLAWTASGRSTKEIADAMSLADSTVNEYISNAQRKLKATNRTQAAARALLLGAVSL